MSRSTKSYDTLTFFICANIMGAISLPIFMEACGFTMSGVEGATNLYNTYGVALVFGVIAGLITGVALSRFFASAERGALYGLFTGTFWTMWLSVTGVVSSLQAQLTDVTSDEYIFPLSEVILFIGVFLWAVTLWRFGGADMEG